MADETQRFMQIKDRIKVVSDQKIRLEERYKSEKQALETVLKSISERGIDPTKLTETRKAKEAELLKLLADLETRTKEAETKLKAMESI